MVHNTYFKIHGAFFYVTVLITLRSDRFVDGKMLSARSYSFVVCRTQVLVIFFFAVYIRLVITMFHKVLEILSFGSQTHVTSNKHAHYILIQRVPYIS